LIVLIPDADSLSTEVVAQLYKSIILITSEQVGDALMRHIRFCETQDIKPQSPRQYVSTYKWQCKSIKQSCYFSQLQFGRVPGNCRLK
jgi:hypothetical protein